MLAAVPLNQQVHDTFFVVAHLHYVLIGGAVFPLLGMVFYWFPKLTGRLLDNGIGTVAFWTLFVGFNLTFFPQHILGLEGMPRRVYTYPAAMGWGGLNLMSSIGAMTIGVSMLIYLYNVAVSLRRGEVAAANPWEASTLEWATASPPPPFNFSPMPTVGDRDPLWSPDPQPVVVGLATDKREVLVTQLMDAVPELARKQPHPTIWPFLAAVAVSVMFVWSIFSPWGVIYGSIPIAITFIGWFWPTDGKRPQAFEHDVASGHVQERAV